MTTTPNWLWAIEPGIANNLEALLKAGAIEDAQRSGLPVQSGQGVALIELGGPMTKYGFWGLPGALDVRRAVRAAREDDAIESIVLRIDSPGGEVDGTVELADEVREAAGEKRVVAQVDGMAASAAYWVASQATEIVAQRMDLVGSIGVRMMLYDVSRAFEEGGVEAVPIDSGPFKSAGALGTEITPEQRAYYQGIVDQTAAEFRHAVSAGRSMSPSAVEAVADGRVFTASEALNLGLIDRIGTLEETIASLVRPVDGRRRAAAALQLRRRSMS